MRTHYLVLASCGEMNDYDPAPTSDEEMEQAYQEKYG